MGQMGYGKTAEGILITPAFRAERIGSATIYYNGQPFTNAAGYGFDTQPFDDCMCVINVGTVAGPLATLMNSVLESETDDPSAATALTNAAFTHITSSNDETMLAGSIMCKDTKRYLFLKTEAQGSPITIDFSASFVGGQAREQPTEQVLEFDV